MKFGQNVSFSKYYEADNTYNPHESWSLREFGVQDASGNYHFPRYKEQACDTISGIITGYKKLSITSQYTLKTIEMLDECGCPEPHEYPKYISSEKCSVYVVQNTLSKKYYVKREWLQEQEAAK